MAKSVIKQDTSSNVPLRQFSLYRPPYEELYSFWWKCMQISLHDKGTQTIWSGPDSARLSSVHDDLYSDNSDAEHFPDTKAVENDQLKQLMAMVNYYNSVGRESRSRLTKTFRGAGALAPGLSASMLTSLTADIVHKNVSTATSMDTTPVMEQRPRFSPSDKSTPELLDPLPSSLHTPSLTSSSSSSPDNVIPQGEVNTEKVPDSNEKITENEIKNEPTELTTTNIFGSPLADKLSVTLSAALLPSLQCLTQSTTAQPLPCLAQPLQSLAQPIQSMAAQPLQSIAETTRALSQPILAQSIPQFTQPQLSPRLIKAEDRASVAPLLVSPPSTSNLMFPETSEQISDLIHIKQLTDVLGRKAVLDSLTPNISSGADLSSYLGTTISMAQAAGLLGQLPSATSTSRALLGSLLPWSIEHVLKSDGYNSHLENSIKTEHDRHYQAGDSDTSNITLPEGFEIEEHLTWSEVEGFVNEFKTKRVKLGYTQAHVGAALALVHGPEFSQTTISRFEGLQLSFANHKKIIPILRRWLESVENPAKRRHSPSTLHSSSPNSNAKRRKRTTISSNSKEILEQYYQTNPLPSTDEIGNLSNNLALDKRVIRIWFQNRRAIGKRLSKLIVTMGGGAQRTQTACSMAGLSMQQQLF